MQVQTDAKEKPIYNGHTHWAYPEHISSVMNVDYSTMRMYLKRKNKDFEIKKSKPLSKEAVTLALNMYAKDTAAKKEAEKIAIALGLNLDVEVEDILQGDEVKPDIQPQNNKPDQPKPERWNGRKKTKKNEVLKKDPETPKKTSEPERWVVSLILSAAIPFAIYSYSEIFLGKNGGDVKWYLYAVFMAAVTVQIEHTCVMAYRYSTISHDIFKWASSGLFAVAFQFTGFILTIESGNHWYLLVFAIVEGLINIFYYSPWQEK